MSEALESEINVIVRDYLQYNDLVASTVAFEAELASRGKHVPPAENISLVTGIKEQMMRALDEGSYGEFNELWNQAIPAQIRRSEGQKIEFYINIYFAIYPINPLVHGEKSTPLATTMATFSQFLATKGAELSKTSAFLAFYALPYVPHPATHPSFQDLFTEEWLHEMKSRVDKFLTNSIKGSELPRMYHLLKKGPSSSRDHDIDIDRSLDMKELLQVAQEMEQQLHRCADGHVIGKEFLRRIGSKLTKFVPEGGSSGTSNGRRKPPASPPLRSASPEVGNIRSSSAPILASLDYTHLQRDLVSVPAKKKCAILQALRWRVRHSEIGLARRMVLQTFIQHDLLGCSNPDNQKLLPSLLSKSDPLTREYAARLVNTISFENAGRSYLLQGNTVIKLLYTILKEETTDSITRQQALGALQKLSLRRSAQNIMIDMGIVGWILEVLSDLDSLSKYSLEYSSALLLNLSLRSEGRRACEAVKSHDVMRILKSLIEHDNMQVRFYTNGTLYSVLGRPKLRDRAKSLGIDATLHHLLRNADESAGVQLEYIIGQLEKKNSEEDDVSDDEGGKADADGDEDGDDVVGDEEEEPESLPHSDQPAGEELLCSNYLAKNADAVKEADQIRRSVALPRGGGVRESQGEFRGVSSSMNRPPTAYGLPSAFANTTPAMGESRGDGTGKKGVIPSGRGINRTPPRERASLNAPGGISTLSSHDDVGVSSRSKMSRTPAGTSSSSSAKMPTRKR